MRINKVIRKNDAKFLFHTNSPIGCWGSPELMEMSLSDIDKYNEDPDLYVAKMNNVTKEEYIQWVLNCFDENGYGVFCTAKTKKGVRCKNVLNRHVSALDYTKDFRNSWCTTHMKTII